MEEEDVEDDSVLEIKEELDFDDELLVVELDNFELLLCKLLKGDINEVK